MLSRAAPLLLLAGCGRLAFDARDAALEDDSAPATQCEIAAPFTSIRRIEELTTGDIDGALRLSEDELTAYFHRRVMSGGPVELYTARRATRDAMFGSPQLVRTGSIEWPSVTRDQLTIVYSDGLDLYTATRATPTGSFGTAIPLSAVNTAESEATPSLVPDGTRLYYVLRESLQMMTAAWPPTSAGTPVSELFTGTPLQGPTPSRDDLAIYYGVDDGSGTEFDIYVATRTAPGVPFGPGVPVAGINAPGADTPTWLSPDQCRLYFESFRAGDFDVYVAERLP